ncbi:IS3 family transposase [Aerococcus christensenii]|uniref:IS3 family transposase n=1 Tax=Aerococcus christensenii TaxID=87541 RepID=UPI003F4379CA
MLKQEMYYRDSLLIYEQLEQKITDYIQHYTPNRIKEKLSGMFLIEYRKHTTQLFA